MARATAKNCARSPPRAPTTAPRPSAKAPCTRAPPKAPAVKVARASGVHAPEGPKAWVPWCTLTAVVQPGRYGSLRLNEDNNRVEGFREKGQRDGGLINGGFFVCEPEMLDLIDDDGTVLEEEPMERLIERGKLASFVHDGYWQSMDSLRDRHILEEQWRLGAPWKIWA